MTVSIIIAVKTWQKNLEECVANCRKLDFSGFEIIILPDEPLYKEEDGLCAGDIPVKVIPTGPINPARKRDMAVAYAKGEIIAFLDDDAYPEADWLKNAVRHFEDKDVAAVGGPAITPLQDSLMQKASGAVYASLLVSGKYRCRYIPLKACRVDDWPSCNLLVRKSVMQELGGFLTDFWPGEDTKLCFDIVEKLKKKIIYDPEALVYHHRRRLFIPHLKQIANYALHRGYFVKKYPQTSLKVSYFLPTVFTLGVLFGGYMPAFRGIYLSSVSLYLFLVLIFSFSKQALLIPFVFLGIILTHLTYGVFFLKGILSWKLKEEIR